MPSTGQGKVACSSERRMKLGVKQKAVSDVYNGKPVCCTKEEYHTEIRSVLQETAGRWIDAGQDIRAVIALNEVKRLDELYGFQALNPNGAKEQL